jgi:hypothetical protein
LIIIAIYFIIVFSLVWLGIIAGVTIAMPLLTNFFPGQEVMTVISMMNLLFVIGIPLIAIILGIIRVVFRRRMGKGWAIGLGLFWLMNAVSFVGLGGTLAQEFLVEDQVEVLMDASTFAGDTVRLNLLKVDESYSPQFHIGPERIELPGADVFTKIRKSTDADWHLMLHKSSRARNGADARELAQQLNVKLDVSPGSITIPSHIAFEELSKWRAQEAKLELAVPVGAYVYLDDKLVHNGGDFPFDQFPEGERLYQMSASGKLICQNCPAASQQEMMKGQSEVDQESLSETDVENTVLNYEGFTSLEINGPMKVTIEQGDVYDIQFSGNGKYQKQLTTVQEGQTLSLNLDGATDAPVRVYIKIPSLGALSLTNTDDVLVKDFTLESLSIVASGEFELKTNISVKDFTLEAQNGVEVELIGTTERLVANLSNESRLDTDRGTVNNATLTATEGSRIKLGENTNILEQSISDDSSLKKMK